MLFFVLLNQAKPMTHVTSENVLASVLGYQTQLVSWDSENYLPSYKEFDDEHFIYLRRSARRSYFSA